MNLLTKLYITSSVITGALLGAYGLVQAATYFNFDQHIPVTKGYVITIADNINDRLKLDNKTILRGLKQDRRLLEFDIEKWHKENPDKPLPPVFNYQRDDLNTEIELRKQLF